MGRLLGFDGFLILLCLLTLSFNNQHKLKVIGIYRNINTNLLDRSLDTIGNSRNDLLELYLILLSKPEAKFELRVHAKDDFFNEYSKRPSFDRAELICAYLYSKGISKDQLVPIAMEFNDPIIRKPKNPVEEMVNNRVELVMLCK